MVALSYIVDVDPEVFDAASKVFGQDMAHGVESAWSKLTGSLFSTAQMAGSDEAGQKWSSQYDPAAQDTVNIMSDLQNACLQIASLLEHTGFNHGMAESKSDPTRSVPTPADRTAYVVGPPTSGVCIAGHDVPLAAGGSGSEPTGWSIVEHAVGYLWPNGDPGKLRTAASAWSTAAGSLEAVGYYVPEATEAIQTQQSREVNDAVTVCTSMQGHINEAAASCHSLSSACSQLAGYIDTAHQNIENELKSFVEWSAGIEIAGGLFSVVTGGLSEAGAQGVEASRIAATAAKIAEFIRTLITAAEGLLDTIGAAVTKVAEVAGKLKLILGAKLSEAASTLAARLPLIGKDAEESANLGLDTAAEINTANDAAYSRYLARLEGEGRTPLGRAAWEKRYNTLRTNKAVGDAYRDQVAADLGIEPGTGGWKSEYTLPGEGRRFDIANPDTQQAYEVKSGTTPTKEGLVQLNKDEKAVQNGWQVTWQLKTDLSPTLMARLQQLADQYPGDFTYSVAGG